MARQGRLSQKACARQSSTPAALTGRPRGLPSHRVSAASCQGQVTGYPTQRKSRPPWAGRPSGGSWCPVCHLCHESVAHLWEMAKYRTHPTVIRQLPDFLWVGSPDSGGAAMAQELNRPVGASKPTERKKPAVGRVPCNDTDHYIGLSLTPMRCSEQRVQARIHLCDGGGEINNLWDSLRAYATHGTYKFATFQLAG
jgi:hypothetical protein